MICHPMRDVAAHAVLRERAHCEIGRFGRAQFHAMVALLASGGAEYRHGTRALKTVRSLALRLRIVLAILLGVAQAGRTDAISDAIRAVVPAASTSALHEPIFECRLKNRTSIARSSTALRAAIAVQGGRRIILRAASCA